MHRHTTASIDSSTKPMTHILLQPTASSQNIRSANGEKHQLEEEWRFLGEEGKVKSSLIKADRRQPCVLPEPPWLLI